MVKLLINYRRNYIGDDDSTVLMALDLLNRTLSFSFLLRAFQLYRNAYSDITMPFSMFAKVML